MSIWTSLLAGLCFAASAQSAELKVVFSKVEPTQGQVLCNLFAKAEGFPGDTSTAIKSLAVEVKDERVVCDFGSVNPGTYAVAAMHDENMNDEMDSNLIGIPKEGWAVSNNASARLFGPPSFESAAFEVDGKLETVQLELFFR